MAGNIRHIVRQRAQRKGVLVDILALEEQLTNKVSTPNVVHQVAEFPTTERIISEILDDRASIGVGMRLFELVLGESGISLEQQRLDLVGPQQIDNLLVRQNRICRRAGT